MGKQTSLEERVEIMELSASGLSDRAISERIGWSIATVRKWRRRGQRKGREGLASLMGRPVQGALSSFPSAVVEALHQWRTEHPGWGPSTLRSELERHPGFSQDEIPSRASIARYLKQQKLTRRYDRHSELLQANPSHGTEPHEVWEMDAQGHQTVQDVGVVALINLNDRFSRARLASYPCLVGRKKWERHPDTEDYQLALRLAFIDWGLPKQLQVDHASPFYYSRSQSPYPTRFHLWVIALGVSLRFSDRATDQAITERSHQLWQKQCLDRQTPYQDWSHLYHTLRRRRSFLNDALPCRSTHNRPPLVAHPDAIHSGRPYHPEHESKLLDLTRVYDYLAQGRWFRQVNTNGTLSLGGQRFYIGTKWARHQFEITFCPDQLHFICTSENGLFIHHQPITTSKESLMGQLSHTFNLPSYQFPLPFDWTTTQGLRLCETLASTTK